MEIKDDKLVTMPISEFYRLSKIEEDYHKIISEKSNIVVIRQWIGSTVKRDSPSIFTKDEVIAEVKEYLYKSENRVNIAEKNYRDILDSHCSLVNKVLSSFIGRILFRRFIIKTTK